MFERRVIWVEQEPEAAEERVPEEPVQKEPEAVTALEEQGAATALENQAAEEAVQGVAVFRSLPAVPEEVQLHHLPRPETGDRECHHL